MSNVTQFFPGGAGGGARQIRYALTGPATQTWTAPPSISVSEVLVICVGGGGNGAQSGNCPFSPGSSSSGGGGSGAIAGYLYPVVAGTTISLTAGGVGGTSSANNPGPSPVPISATGGSAGSQGAGCDASNPGVGGAGGVASTPGVANSISIGGQPGTRGSYSQGALGSGGAGGIITNALSAFGINFNTYIDPEAGQIRSASTTIVLKTVDSKSAFGDGGTGGPACTSGANFYTLGGSGSPGAVFIYY